MERVYMISSFRREVDELCALLGSYEENSGNFLTTFRDILFASSRILRDSGWDRQVVPKIGKKLPLLVA
jgi:hypothetical protein